MKKKSNKQVNASKGKRYTDKEKAQVLDKVAKHNAKHGRGGISSCSKATGISPLTISNWLRDSIPAGGKASKPKPAKVATVVQSDNPATSSELGDMLRRLAYLLEEADSLREQIKKAL